MTTINLFRNAEDIEEYKDGEVIFEDGDQGDVMYGVVEGRVDVIKRGNVIDTLEPGSIFGEMALVDGSPRSATVKAYGEAKIAPVNKSRFQFLVQQHPFFSLQVMSIMAERLRKQMEA